MAYPKLTPIVATGSTEPRYLADRFADCLNVKDFGAKGDGITDDRTAFAAASSKAALRGCKVFVPAGTYALSDFVSGEFVSDGYVDCPWIDVQDLSLEPMVFPDPSCLNNVGVDFGGAKSMAFDGKISEYHWDRASQGHSFDIWDNVLYFGGTQAVTNKERLVAVKWDRDEANRTVLGVSKWYDANTVWQHQGVCVYRPHPKAPIKFLVGSYQESFVLKLVSWDYSNPDFATVEKTFVAFEPDLFNLSRQTALAVSPDGKYTVMRAKRNSDNKDVYRVWLTKTIISCDSGTDISNKYEWEFVEPQGDYTYSCGGQGIYTDGNFIYALYGSEQAICRVFSIDGKDGFDSNPACLEVGKTEISGETFEKIVAEPEGIFFVCINRRIEIFYALSFSCYPDIEQNTYYRFEKYVCMSMSTKKNNVTTYHDFTVDTKHSSFNDYINDEIAGLTFSNPIDGAPPVVNGWLQTYACTPHNDKGRIIKQVFYRLGTLNSNDFNTFVRTGNISADGVASWSDWVRFLTSKGIADIHGLASGSSFLRFYDTNDDSSGRGYGFITKDRSSNAALGTDVDVSVRLGFIDGSATYAVLLQASGSNGGSTKAAYAFIPNGNNACSLGRSDLKFSVVYAGTGSINTSDARLKTEVDNINDALMRAWGHVNFKVFKFIDAVEKKGNSARMHVGVIAQEVQAAFEAEGLDASRYGLFCYDEWPDQYESVEVQDGEDTRIEMRLIRPAGNEYGIRYEEALALECAYQRWRLEQLEERVNQLTNNTNN